MVEFDRMQNWYWPNLVFYRSNLTELDRIWCWLYRILYKFDRISNRSWPNSKLKLTDFFNSVFKNIRSPLPNWVEFLIEYFWPNMTEHLETVPNAYIAFYWWFIIYLKRTHIKVWNIKVLPRCTTIWVLSRRLIKMWKKISASSVKLKKYTK